MLGVVIYLRPFLLRLAHVPAKACPDLIGGGDRFADKNML